MGRFRSSGPWLVVAISFFLGLAACGGGKAGPPLYPGKIALTPSVTSSMNLGDTASFLATVQTASGTNLSTTVTYTSSDTSILNLSSSGVACAGHWDVNFTVCIPGASGVVAVTASALGGTSVPTYVFVHPPIDNVTVSGILLDGVPVQEPCLSQGQTMTLEAHAYSQGSDITGSVGPFTWTANNTTVATITPLTNTTINPATKTTYNFATNQATALANTPGITYIYASASGVTSTTFLQPQLTNAQGASAPALDFFSTCPIQNIALEVNRAGSGQTSLSVAKGTTAQTVVATLLDIMGNSSLPNNDGGPVLNKVPLTWTSSSPGAITLATACTQSCGLTLTSPGAATITASCSPPSCNIGYPVVPATLSTTTQIQNCTTYFTALYPTFAGCQFLIPTAVYSSNEFVVPGTTAPLSPTGAVSAVITGANSPASIFAGSTGCAHVSPTVCSASVYYFSSAKPVAGSENPTPVPPNSFMFDPAGLRVYTGSDFGVESVNPASFGTTTAAFSSLGTATGRVLAVSSNGNSATFSDTLHTPNQVYITGNSTTLNGTVGGPVALAIPNATTAAYSPDGLRTFIVGGTSLTSLYIYSSLQALQGPFALAGPSNAITFSPNGAFAFVAQSVGSAGTITAFATCNNSQVATSVALPANPILMRVLPNVHIDGTDSYGYKIPDGIHLLVMDSTGFNIITSTISQPAAGTACPQGLTFTSNDLARPAQRIELGQSISQPFSSANFFASPDGEQLYVVNPGSSSILVYGFIAGAVTGGIPLVGGATPVASDVSVDASTIAVIGNDGLIHLVSTFTGGADLNQVSFPDLPSYLNPFCTITPSSGPCTLDTVLVKP